MPDIQVRIQQLNSQSDTWKYRSSVKYNANGTQEHTFILTSPISFDILTANYEIQLYEADFTKSSLEFKLMESLKFTLYMQGQDFQKR